MRPSLLTVPATVAAIMLAVAACSSPSATGGPSTPAPSTSATSRTSAPATSSGAASSPSTVGATTGAGSPKPSAVVTESSPPGDISDTAVYVVHTEPAAHYSVKVLEGWSQTTAGGAVRFTDKLNAITLSTQAAASAPTVATARAVTVPQLQQSEPAFALKDVTALTRHAGPVVLVHYERDSQPNDVTGKVFREDVYRYVFFHAGTELDVVLSGATGSDNVDPWRTVTDSVTWTK